jgi:hypothetical protein
MKLPNRRLRQGFTLLEVMGLMASLIAAMLLGGTILIGALRTQQFVSGAQRRLVQRNELVDQFRCDVAGAVGMADSFAFGEEKQTAASPTFLILKRPDQHEVVYLWRGGELWRWEPLGGKLQRRRLPVGSDCTGIEFVHGTGDRALVTMRLKVKGPKDKPDLPIDLTAVLGGDLR